MQLLESLHIHLSEHMIRKMAHFAIYALLSISYIQMLKSYQCRRYALYGIIMAVLFAATDEFHQTFVSGRSGEFGDIVIDSMGILLGYLLTVLTLKNPLGKSS